MTEEQQALLPASLEYRLTYPQGSDSTPFARLVIIDVDTHITVAEIDMSVNDFADFMAGRTSGPREGEARLVSQRLRPHLSRMRLMVREVIAKFPASGGRAPQEHIDDAARSAGVDTVRSHKNNTGSWVIDFIFYVDSDDDSSIGWVRNGATNTIRAWGRQMARAVEKESAR